jgi:hypothetical protein
MRWYLCVGWLAIIAMATMACDNGGAKGDGATPGGDPCASNVNVDSLSGCNGGIPGVQPDGQLGGFCVPDESDLVHWGSCVGEYVYCLWEEIEDGGICVTDCELATTYVSTGGCPTGYRCFNDAEFEEPTCFPDCNDDSDCPEQLQCDADGSCYPHYEI